MNAREILLRQKRLYPALRPADAIKALYQAAFGCGHLVREGEGLKRLADEIAAMGESDWRVPEVEVIGGGYSRAHLRGLNKAGLKPETLIKLFKLSSEEAPASREEFDMALGEFVSMCRKGDLDMDADEAEREALDIKAKGYQAVSHSPEFRRLYRPAYRVILSRFARLIELFCYIDRAAKPKIIAIDGPCASGKSTLAELLARVYGCEVYHMDDFFLRPEQRAPERLCVPGENVDHERFLEEVLKPLKSGAPFSYRPYECANRALGHEIASTPGPIGVVEGAYSLHPALAGYYSLKVFMTADLQTRLGRILRRNGADMLKRFEDEWIPLEDAYFQATGVERRCDLAVRDWEAIE